MERTHASFPDPCDGTEFPITGAPVTPFWQDDHLTLYGGDCRAVLATMAPESVHCVVTSPPYWGLRDYGTATWEGGDEACDHSAAKKKTRYDYGLDSSPIQQGSRTGTDAQVGMFAADCPACGAHRIDSQLGLEPTPEEYVANMVAVFREVRRVLRADGTLWLNLGDSYTSGGRDSFGTFQPDMLQASNPAIKSAKRPPQPAGLKPKDLVGIPWRVAFALQADGWYLRSDIIWSKPNPMPESVTDRPTKAHEYLFLLSKQPRYYFDADAVREPHTREWASETVGPGYMTPQQGRNDGGKRQGTEQNPAGRNLRSVWTIATEPYPGAHFATFPRKLVEPCVKAGTSERGVCPECGAPWVRVVERERTDSRPGHEVKLRQITTGNAAATGRAGEYDTRTTGWRPSCDCFGDGRDGTLVVGPPPVPAVVLDPFAGSGTTLLVAQSLGRRGVGIDLSPEYLKQALARNAQTPLGLVG